MNGDHDRHVEDVAPYVLGALDPPEAEEFERHLRGCGQCQRELAELRSGAESLARAVEQVEPPDALRDTILEQVAAEAGTPDEPAEAGTAPSSASKPTGSFGRLAGRVRRGGARRSGIPRPALAAAAVVLAIVTGATGWILGSANDPDDAEERTLAGEVDRSRLPGASARMTIPPENRDAVLRLAGLSDVGSDRTYEIWVQRDGKLAPGPLFSPNADGEAMTGIPGDARGIEAVLVTREPAGGARSPSEEPVISVPLSS